MATSTTTYIHDAVPADDGGSTLDGLVALAGALGLGDRASVVAGAVLGRPVPVEDDRPDPGICGRVGHALRRRRAARTDREVARTQGPVAVTVDGRGPTWAVDELAGALGTMSYDAVCDAVASLVAPDGRGRGAVLAGVSGRNPCAAVGALVDRAAAGVGGGAAGDWRGALALAVDAVGEAVVTGDGAMCNAVARDIPDVAGRLSDPGAAAEGRSVADDLTGGGSVPARRVLAWLLDNYGDPAVRDNTYAARAAGAVVEAAAAALPAGMGTDPAVLMAWYGLVTGGAR